MAEMLRIEDIKKASNVVGKYCNLPELGSAFLSIANTAILTKKDIAFKLIDVAKEEADMYAQYIVDMIRVAQATEYARYDKIVGLIVNNPEWSIEKKIEEVQNIRDKDIKYRNDLIKLLFGGVSAGISSYTIPKYAVPYLARVSTAMLAMLVKNKFALKAFVAAMKAKTL